MQYTGRRRAGPRKLDARIQVVAQAGAVHGDVWFHPAAGSNALLCVHHQHNCLVAPAHSTITRFCAAFWKVVAPQLRARGCTVL